MKKAISICVLAMFVSAVSVSVSACPAGTHPVGGEGPHHKGGTCQP